MSLSTKRRANYLCSVILKCFDKYVFLNSLLQNSHLFLFYFIENFFIETFYTCTIYIIIFILIKIFLHSITVLTSFLLLQSPQGEVTILLSQFNTSFIFEKITKQFTKSISS